jgi:hypothetical protein
MMLSEIASVIRSKNAGPYIFTFDILFPDQETFRQVRLAGKLSREAVAKVYGISPNEILGFDFYEFANAVKFSIRRPIASGSAGDSDIYGAQQHAPLLTLQAV